MNNNDPALAPRHKAYSYLRFSTPEQAKGDSFRRQTAMAQSYALKNGLELDEELTFHDVGVSAYRGQNADAGMLAYFVEAVHSGLVPQGSLLLVEQLDRISRLVPRRALRVLEDILDAGVSVVTLNDERVYSAESIDSLPLDLIISILTFMRANEESATKSKRLRAAWENKRANIATRPLTSKAPAWLAFNRDTQAFEVIPERALLVKRIYDLALEGVGKHKIAQTFNDEGLKPWGRGKHWHRSYIAKILLSPGVIGTLVPHIMEHEGAKKSRRALDAIPDYYPAVVDGKTYAEVQALQGVKAPSRGRHTTSPLVNILAGMATCSLCGQVMTRVHKGKRSRPAFVCTSAKVGGGCTYKSVRYDWVEESIIHRLPGYLTDIPAGTANEALDGEIFSFEVHISELADQARDLLTTLNYGPSTTLSGLLREKEAKIVGLQATLAELLERRELTSGPLIGARVANLLTALAEVPHDPAAINLAMRRVFRRVVIEWQPARLLELEFTHGGSCILGY